MRSQPNLRAERYRDHGGIFGSGPEDGVTGVYRVNCKSRTLTVLVTEGFGWDHVSVSLPDRCPTWEEMAFIKDLFFCDDEVVVQYHPRKREYIENHRFCLHLWRWQGGEFPTPPPELVGFKGMSVEDVERLHPSERLSLLAEGERDGGVQRTQF